MSYRPLFLSLYSLLIIFLFFMSCVQAAKVTLDPSAWGLAEGKSCIDCHSKSSSALTRQWKNSAHAQANVNCLDCHQAYEDDDDAIEHEGHIIATIVSPKDCGRCHETEYKQQKGSTHVKAIAILKQRMPKLSQHFGGDAGHVSGCAKCHGSEVKVRGDGSLDPATWPNTGIGRINPDGSYGACSACHGRHQFSKAQARDPSACTHCHTGIESPDKVIFETSKHGMLYEAHRDEMNLNSDQWVVGKDYFAAPTCVTCHMGAAGKMPSTHDVGMRDAWNLNSPVSTQQYLIIFEDGDKRELAKTETIPRRGENIEKLDGSIAKVKAVATPKRRRQAMMKTCLECHSKGFAKNSMQQFDDFVELYNDKYGKPAQAIMQSLYDANLLTPLAFDEAVEHTYWGLWHNEGTRARHGAAMGSANMTWWQGMQELGNNFYGKFLPQVREIAGKKADVIFAQHLDETDYHQWLKNDRESSPVLGLDAGKDNED